MALHSGYSNNFVWGLRNGRCTDCLYVSSSLSSPVKIHIEIAEPPTVGAEPSKSNIAAALGLGRAFVDGGGSVEA